MKDFMQSIQLQAIAKICGGALTIKTHTAEVLSQLLKCQIEELARITKEMAYLEGRTEVNAGDVLKVLGSFQYLREYLVDQEAEMQQSPYGVFGVLTHYRCSKLRNMLADANHEKISYIPNFLPVLTRVVPNIAPLLESKSASTEKNISITESQVFHQELVGMFQTPNSGEAKWQRLNIKEMPQSNDFIIESSSAEISLRNSQKEHGLVSKADGIISGVFPVLDNF